MSEIRHGSAEQPAVRGYAVTHPRGSVVLPIGAGWDQLLYAAHGVMTITTPAGTWVVPPHRALWVPDGAPAEIETSGRVAVRTLYLRSSLGMLGRVERAVNVSAFGRELILRCIARCPLDLGDPAAAAMLTLLADEMATMPDAPVQLPAPRSEVAVDAARRIETDVGAGLDAVAASVGASRRTLERLFAAETGMTLGAWRRRARTLRALALLADGASVTATALAVGYATPSSFVAAFRRELGTTPGEFSPA